jgi:hypothetical protein
MFRLVPQQHAEFISKRQLNVTLRELLYTEAYLMSLDSACLAPLAADAKLIEAFYVPLRVCSITTPTVVG